MSSGKSGQELAAALIRDASVLTQIGNDRDTLVQVWNATDLSIQEPPERVEEIQNILSTWAEINRSTGAELMVDGGSSNGVGTVPGGSPEWWQQANQSSSSQSSHTSSQSSSSHTVVSSTSGVSSSVVSGEQGTTGAGAAAAVTLNPFTWGASLQASLGLSGSADGSAASATSTSTTAKSATSASSGSMSSQNASSSHHSTTVVSTKTVGGESQGVSGAQSGDGGVSGAQSGDGGVSGAQSGVAGELKTASQTPLSALEVPDLGFPRLRYPQSEEPPVIVGRAGLDSQARTVDVKETVEVDKSTGEQVVTTVTTETVSTASHRELGWNCAACRMDHVNPLDQDFCSLCSKHRFPQHEELLRLRSSVEELRTSVSTWQTRYETASEQLETCQVTRKQLTSDNALLQQQVETLHASVTTYEQRVSSYEAQVLEWRTKYEKLLAESEAQLKSSGSEWETRYASLQKTHSSTVAQLQTAQSEVSAWEAKWGVSQQELRRVSADLKRELAARDAGDKALKTLRGTVSQRDAEIVTLKAQIAELQQQLGGLEGGRDALQAREAAAQERIAALEAQIAQLQQRVRELVSERDRLSQELDSHRQDHDSTRKSLAMEEQAKAAIEETVLSREAELEQLRAQVQQLEQEIAERDQTIAQLKKTMSSLHGDLDEREEIILNLRRSLAAREQAVASLGQDVNDRDETIERLRADIAALNQQIDSMKGEVTRLESASRSATTTIEELRRELTAAQAAAGRHRARIGELEQELDEAQGLVRTRDGALRVLREEHASQAQTHQRKVAVKDGEIADLAAQLEKHRKMLAEHYVPKHDLAALDAQWRSKYDAREAQLASAQQKQLTMETAHQQAVQQWDGEKSGLSGENQRLQDVNVSLEGANQQLREQNDTLKGVNARLQGDKDRLTQELAALEARAKQLRGDLNQAEADAGRVSQEHADALSEQEAAHLEEVGLLKDSIAQYKGRVVKLQRIIHQLKNTRTVVSTDSGSEWKVKYMNVVQEVQNIKGKLSERQRIINELRQERDALLLQRNYTAVVPASTHTSTSSSVSNSQVVRYKEQISSLRRKLRAAEQRSSNVSSNTETMRRELDSMERRYRENQSAYRALKDQLVKKDATIERLRSEKNALQTYVNMMSRNNGGLQPTQQTMTVVNRRLVQPTAAPTVVSTVPAGAMVQPGVAPLRMAPVAPAQPLMSSAPLIPLGRVPSTANNSSVSEETRRLLQQTSQELARLRGDVDTLKEQKQQQQHGDGDGYHPDELNPSSPAVELPSANYDSSRSDSGFVRIDDPFYS